MPNKYAHQQPHGEAGGESPSNKCKEILCESLLILKALSKWAATKINLPVGGLKVHSSRNSDIQFSSVQSLSRV